MRMRTFIAIVGWALGGPVCAQTLVSVRPAAEVAPGAQEVRLADIADIAGDEAEALGSIRIGAAPATGRPSRFDISDVRASLESAGVNWGRVSLRGAACMVTAPPSPGSAVPEALDHRAERARAGMAKPQAIDMTGPPTVRTTIAARLAVAHGVSVDRLRLGFDEADKEVLDMPVADRRVVIDFGGSELSARVPATVTAYSGDTIALKRTVQADVLVRRPSLKAAKTLERGRVIEREDLAIEDRWSPPGRGSALLGNIEDAVGSVTGRRIAVGQELRRDDLSAALACRRGDTVLVHCLSGSVVVKMRARALGAARDGELVELRREGAGRDEKPFTARMAGRGRAVVETSAAD